MNEQGLWLGVVTMLRLELGLAWWVRDSGLELRFGFGVGVLNLKLGSNETTQVIFFVKLNHEKNVFTDIRVKRPACTTCEKPKLMFLDSSVWKLGCTFLDSSVWKLPSVFGQFCSKQNCPKP